MSKSATALPRVLIEDYLALLRILVRLAWLGVVIFVGVEAWIRLGSKLAWPRLGGFSFTYNAILLEFALNALLLTTLLLERNWYERVPRNAEHRVRWLFSAVVLWAGLHLFAAFHVTGSVAGPLLPLLPVALVAALVALPGLGGWLIFAYLLAGHAAVVALESIELLHPRGPLAAAFQYRGPLTPIGAVTLAGVMVASAALALALRQRLYPGDGTLTPAQRIDPETGLFCRAFLEQRMRAELGRTRRQGGSDALLLLGLDGAAAAAPSAQALRAAAQAMIGRVRLRSDTPAHYAPAVLGVLLPACDANGARSVALRIAGQLEGSGLRLRTAVCAVDGGKAEPAQVMAAAENALRRAAPGEVVIVSPEAA
jgi:GGDEF domain-containing protein